MTLKEIWKPIASCSGMYEISNLGRVKSHKRKNEKILKPRANLDGYLQVNLTGFGKSKYVLVHRLVAQAFIPNPKKLPQVNHKNEIKDDNRLSNLEWCTAKYNNNYGHHGIKIAQKFMPTTMPGRELIKKYLKDNDIKTSDLAKTYGMTKQEVSDYLSGRKKNPASNQFILKVIRDFKIS